MHQDVTAVLYTEAMNVHFSLTWYGPGCAPHLESVAILRNLSFKDVTLSRCTRSEGSGTYLLCPCAIMYNANIYRSECEVGSR